jgi:hypothetical protein
MRRSLSFAAASRAGRARHRAGVDAEPVCGRRLPIDVTIGCGRPERRRSVARLVAKQMTPRPARGCHRGFTEVGGELPRRNGQQRVGHRAPRGVALGATPAAFREVRYKDL